MITIKTKEAASVWIGLLATAIAAGLLFAMEAILNPQEASAVGSPR